MKKILTFMFAATLLASCQQEENGTTTSESNHITISPIITRATEVNFENTDQIGVTITQSNDFVYAANQLMTFNNGLFSSALTWYPEGNDESQIVAYYPYNAAGAPTSFSVKTDQTTGYGESDLMAASKSGVTPSTNAISMNFKHLLSKLVINVENETQSGISSVVLKGSVPTATVDLASLSVAVDENAATTDITTQAVTTDKTYRAIVIPQTVAFTLEVATADGNTLSQRLASTTLTQSGQYSVNVRVLADDIIVTLSGEIDNWTDEGEISADNEVPFEEHLDENYFLYDGVKYNTVTLANGKTWMAEPLAYLPKGYTASADPEDLNAHIWYPYQLIDEDEVNSVSADRAEALTDEASIKKIGYLYDMYAALGVKEITEENCYNFEGSKGICPKGWHIPTREESLALCGYSTKTTTEDSPKTDESALFYDATGSGGGKLSKYNDAGWNFVLSGCVFKSTLTGKGRYQLTRLWSGNTTLTELYGQPGLTYIITSTCYQPNSQKTNIQFFGQMTTFTTAAYPEGRISLAYVSAATGMQLRCIRD